MENKAFNMEFEEEIFDLKNCDPDDISDVILKIEKSFQIKFYIHELDHIKDFGLSSRKFYCKSSE